MGLSLRNIRNKIDAIGAQLNPLDNGATYNSVRQGGPVSNPGPSVAHQLGQIGYQSVVQPAHTLYTAGISNPVRLGAAELTHNTQALNNVGQSIVANNPGKVVGSGIQLGTLAAPIPGLKAGGAIAPRIIKGMAGGAGIGAVASAGSQLATTGKIQLKPTLENAGVGAVLGGAPVVTKAALKYNAAQNEVGAVGKNVGGGMTPEQLAMARQIHPGLTDAELQSGYVETGKLAKYLSQPAKGSASKSVTGSKSLLNLSAEDKANLSPKDQMSLAKVEGAGPPSKVEIAAGMKANPYKSNVIPVDQGNFSAGRLSGAAVADPIRVAGRIADTHLDQLSKSDPAAFKSFWDNVEKGTVPKSAGPAAQWFREVANGVHKESNVLGTPTRYKQNWELRAASLKDTTPENIATGELGSIAKHTLQRKYNTHAEFVAAAKKAGLTVEDNPRVALRKYVQATSSALERKAIAKGLAEADAGNLTKPHTLDLGWGTTVKLSDQGLAHAKGVQLIGPSGKTLSLYDAINSMAKGSLLSISQFHPVNISVLRAGPALLMPKPGHLMHGDLTMGVHPGRAAKGIYGTFRALGPGGENYVTKNLAEAYKSGDIAFAARHGLPFGKTSYGELGGKFNIGHRTVFEKQLPMMHKEIVGAMRDGMKVFGVKEGSPQAIELGKVMNATMGFMNREAMNVSPTVVKGIQRFFLAGQFTPSKLINVQKAVTKGGAAGSYARADVAANAIGAAALVGGIGYLLHQQSDNARDIALRALVDPAAPTNTKDSKGNNVEVRIPMTYTAEISKLLGIKLKRGADGHLTVDWHPGNIPSTSADWMRARLSPVASTAVKLRTNTSFGQKPLYDPNAPTSTQAIQAATTITQGLLPIGAQGLAYTDAVKKRLPQASQDVLNANTPASNPVLKSLTSSVGFTPRTDQTTGKALDTARYFDAKDAAGKGLNAQAKAAFDLYTGSKKNPVTGKYDVKPTVWDTITKSTALLQNPQALNAIINMNQKIASQGGKVDPLWTQSPDKIKSYLEYQSIPDPFSNQRTAWYNNNKNWYQPLSDARSSFFGSLPSGDPNKPAQPIEYPAPSTAVQKLKDQYYAISDPSAAYQFSKAHPELQTQFDKEFQYKNDLLQARGLSEYKGYPKAQPQLQSFIDKYMAADKGTRKGLRNSNPGAYTAMSAYFDSVNLYNINKQGATDQLVGQPDQTSKQNKAISNLAKDIYQNADGTYSIIPAGWMQGLKNGSGGGGGYGSSSKSAPQSRISLSKGKVSAPKVSIKKGGLKSTLKVAKVAKPKVTIKKSTV